MKEFEIQTQKLSAVSKYKRYYTNHLPVIRETLIKKRKQSRLYRFDADRTTGAKHIQLS